MKTPGRRKSRAVSGDSARFSSPDRMRSELGSAKSEKEKFDTLDKSEDKSKKSLEDAE